MYPTERLHVGVLPEELEGRLNVTVTCREGTVCDQLGGILVESWKGFLWRNLERVVGRNSLEPEWCHVAGFQP